MTVCSVKAKSSFGRWHNRVWKGILVYGLRQSVQGSRRMACVIGNPCYCVLGNSENAVGGLFIGAVGIVIIGFAELSSFSEQITTNAADVMSRLLNEVFCFGALFQRLEHQVQLCLRMKMRACPLKSHMGDTTETAVFHPCQFERTISHWVPSVTGKAWRRQFLR